VKAFLFVWLIIKGLAAAVDIASLLIGNYPQKRCRGDTKLSLAFSLTFIAWAAMLLARGQ
jgi:hypothetical protein